ncbi:MAG: histidine kinase [Candidatus Didemnitutus sp.]|nr:histidine kinase [Candidatus Didemnitutus sp.]
MHSATTLLKPALYRSVLFSEPGTVSVAPSTAAPTRPVARLHAHFLFNALHAVGTLVRLQRNDEAARAIFHLAELERHLVEKDDRTFVPLSEELDLIQLYLGFERIRFGDSLRVVVECDPEVRDLPVPNLILLPLVENAVKHGIARRAGQGRIEVFAGRRDGALCLEVRNDPPLRDKPVPAGLGYGQRATRERLAALYGGRATFTFAAQPPHGLAATLQLPA